MYNATNIPKATKRVNISGDTPPDIWMSILDSYGNLQKFHIRELLLQGTRKETNSARQERVFGVKIVLFMSMRKYSSLGYVVRIL